MNLEHNKVTQEEAAKNLKVLLNGQKCKAERIAIVRRDGGRDHWVYMRILEVKSCMQFEYYVERRGMIDSWMALEVGEKKYAHLRIEVNKEQWVATDVRKSLDENNQEWVYLDIQHVAQNLTQSIAIERQSIIDAYYALRLNIEDIVDNGIAVFKGFIQQL